MSESTVSKTGITRRSFLKATGAVAGVSVIAGGMGAGLALAETTPEESTEDEIYCGACRCNCAGGCFLNIHVRDGKVVRTSARDFPEPEYNRICAKGLTHLYRIYSDKRVKYPMKRVGERGSVDSFERISWDEAINLIADRWKEIEGEYGKGSVALYWGSGQFGTANGCRMNDIWNRFINVTGAGMINRSVDIAYAHGSFPTVGIGLMFAQNESTDFKNSKTFIVWGANPAISQVHNTHFILEAKEAGAKLIVIDPVFNTMASKADIFVPVKAGTDGALALGMAKIIVENGWADEDFIKKYTVGPQLVKDSDGMFLKQSDIGATPTDGKDLPIVTDGNGTFATLAEVQDPVLLGSFEVNGIKVRPSYEIVLESLEPYDLKSVSEITGVSEDLIVEVADIYANETPANIYSAFGLNHYVNGHWSYFCQALLPCLTGNLGRSGSGFGLNEYMAFTGNPLSGKPAGCQGASLDVTNLRMPEILATGKFGDKDALIKGCVFVGCNAMTNGTERNTTKEWLEKLDFIVSIDLNFNETTLMADYVLPVSHWFEEEDIFCLFAAHPYMLYQEKVMEPLYESKSDFEIATLLACALGYEEYFNMTDSEFLQEWLDNPLAKTFGITYDKLKDKKAMRMAPPGYVYADGRKFTSTLGIYHETTAPEYNWGQEIDMSKEKAPYWEPPHEVRDDPELRAKFPFHMLSDHSRFHTHSQWWEATPLIELVNGEPELKINPSDAAEYGIENGDLVRIYNDRGSVTMRAFHNAGLPRKMLSAPKGWQKQQQIDGHFSSLTSRYVNPACTNAAFNDVVVNIEKVQG